MVRNCLSSLSGFLLVKDRVQKINSVRNDIWSEFQNEENIFNRINIRKNIRLGRTYKKSYIEG